MSKRSQRSFTVGALSSKGGNVEIITVGGVALSTSKDTSVIKSAGAITGTLGAGNVGEKKYVVMTAHGGDYTLTVSPALGFSTATFTAVGSGASFVYTDAGWVNTGVHTVTLA